MSDIDYLHQPPSLREIDRICGMFRRHKSVGDIAERTGHDTGAVHAALLQGLNRRRKRSSKGSLRWDREQEKALKRAFRKVYRECPDERLYRGLSHAGWDKVAIFMNAWFPGTRSGASCRRKAGRLGIKASRWAWFW